MVSAVSASGYDVLLLRKARERLTESVRIKSDEIASGISKGDQFDYGKRCGQIQGLKDALAILEDTAQQMMGEDRKDE